MNDAPDRTFHKLRVDAKLLSDIVEIMSRNGRRTIVKLNGQKVDMPAAAASVGGAGEIDVSSFWANPDRPDHGRRHFVYFLSGATGTQYFGDSISPEVTRVCEDLDAYFGREAIAEAQGDAAAVVPMASTAAAPQRPAAFARTAARPASRGERPAWWPSDGSNWFMATRERFMASLVVGTLLLLLLGFLIGRLTAPEPQVIVFHPAPQEPATPPDSEAVTQAAPAAPAATQPAAP